MGATVTGISWPEPGWPRRTASVLAWPEKVPRTLILVSNRRQGILPLGLTVRPPPRPSRRAARFHGDPG